MCKMQKKIVAFLFVALFVFASCAWAETPVLRMATTTSTDNTGLLDYLAPLFKADTGIELQWVAVGTGKALELGKNCDVDILLVHAPDTEKKYVEDGYGVNRRQTMYNDFIIIGPKDDPARIKELTVVEALSKIASSNASFASRGDKSGTHIMEMNLWKEAGLAPDKEAWYIQTGQGMINTINIAAERSAYTMTDRGTFIKYEDVSKGNSPFAIVVEGDPVLRNQYSVIAVNPARCDNVKYDLALKFIDWIVSPQVQEKIGKFELLGKTLFFPNADAQ
ncbi:MAG: substrate-binding domain-containing protein [Aminobacterium sp.]|jgi:tungstate transport system substrate-binding protein|uniref:substrate-binding domain-containing protein n=1 Tax=unclassified Aminobacterium TaxID=2685012 RepID=UPI001BCB993B|nr:MULTISPECIES: substrate-binding domain-containing protein [unclassified Aminobacterium]MDD2205950.1 substrate-binding domain-containing protein [Aminobacterium sp.]MDD3707584.1 substrate-binding domain-containing protein [Aminobacterium sp.]MDD4227893.1 substrate-binding domain-containing protein [Aminobacterium sp.]MDD4550667.1 substrate-binding domain-containing protein [Aminobacterium sp.]MEA4877119.1 substrate-binding domain-containing protein [Aminobacterium sp.]